MMKSCRHPTHEGQALMNEVREDLRCNAGA